MARPPTIPGLGPDSPWKVAASALVQARLGDVRQYEGRVRRGDDASAVHQMRIAVRRLRAAIQAVGDDALTALEPEVKRLQDALGRVRDVQVRTAWLTSHGPDTDVEPLLAQAREELGPTSEGLARQLHHWMDGGARRIAEAADGLLPKGRLGGRRLRRQMDQGVARLRRRLAGALDAGLTPRPTHRLRIATKRLRYLAEIAEPGFPKRARRMRKALGALQKRLGALHDADVRIGVLERLSRVGRGSEPTAARSLLAEVRLDRARQAESLALTLACWPGSRLPRRVARGLA